MNRVMCLALVFLCSCAPLPSMIPKDYAIGDGAFLHEGKLGAIHSQIEFFDAYDCNKYVKSTWGKYASRGETPHCTSIDLSSALPWKASMNMTSTRYVKISSADELHCKETLDIGMYLAGQNGVVTALCKIR